jgi:hypothetical protein
MEGEKNGNIYAVGVLTGTTTKEKLTESGADLT